ncbi:uncharacterized protein LOC133800774 isoform X2 [Humulus lupulus]|uniref:uncharacterized protein LOC133800774 isoform X2 n=1 Tax=Humulus lupulus TaxID=3486 RepID=UPI002B40CAAC|nr:uncharacterized protein LOC133800774 isoform X2 [Humulus lupulus]
MDEKEGAVKPDNVLFKDCHSLLTGDEACFEWSLAVFMFRRDSRCPWSAVQEGVQRWWGKKLCVSYFSDDRALIWCANKREKERLISTGSVTIPELTAVSFAKWSWRNQMENRKISCKHDWIGIEGIPLNIWNHHVFKVIGSLCGGLLAIDKHTLERKNLFCAYINVKGDALGFIPSFISLPYDGNQLSLCLVKARGKKLFPVRKFWVRKTTRKSGCGSGPDEGGCSEKQQGTNAEYEETRGVVKEREGGAMVAMADRKLQTERRGSAPYTITINEVTVASRNSCLPLRRIFNRLKSDLYINCRGMASTCIYFKKVEHWLNELCEELNERLHSDLDQNKRIVRTLTLHATAYKSCDSDAQKNFPSKSCPLRYGAAKMQEDALNLFQAGLREYLGTYNTRALGSQNNGWRITGLSVSASKIVEIPSGTSSIMKYFHSQSPSSLLSKQSHHFVQDTDQPSHSGAESCSEMNLIQQQTNFPDEDTMTKGKMPCLDQQENNKDLQNEQIPCCLPLDRGQDDITQEAYLSTLGTESCSGINKSEEHEVFHGEETTGQCGMSSLNRPEQKRKAMKEKLGTRSILKFFKKTDPSCSSIKEHADNLQNVELASTGVRLTERPIEVSDINNGQCTLTQSEHKEAWSYKIDEIDSSVVDELPPEIQEEVRLCLRPQKRSNIAKRGSSIADYFLPTRKT